MAERDYGPKRTSERTNVAATYVYSEIRVLRELFDRGERVNVEFVRAIRLACQRLERGMAEDGVDRMAIDGVTGNWVGYGER